MGGNYDPKSRPIDDISDWGDRPQSSYDPPLEVFGEKVDVDKLPPLGDGDGDEGRPAPAGRRAPLRRKP